MSFQEMLEHDNAHTFLNPGEFAVLRTIRLDGEVYQDIPIVLSGAKEGARPRPDGDRAQGLYLVSRVLHCQLSDLNGHQPERGQRLRINDREGSEGFFQSYYVANSVCEIGMLRLELEAIDE